MENRKNVKKSLNENLIASVILFISISIEQRAC